MLIINGQEVISGAWITNSNWQQLVDVKTTDYTLTVNDTGKTIQMNAAANNKAITLFTPVAADVGKRFTFTNIGTGRLTVNVAGSGVQLNNGTAATGTMYSDDDYVASLTVEVQSATKWTVISAVGTWATT